VKIIIAALSAPSSSRAVIAAGPAGSPLSCRTLAEGYISVVHWTNQLAISPPPDPNQA